MVKRSIYSFIKQLNHPVFTTRQMKTLSGKSLSNVTQSLNHLKEQDLIFKIYHGVWAETGHKQLSPYNAIPFLFPQHRLYLSFVSALHVYGIIEQIPQVITLASTCHTKTIKTKIGTFYIHQLKPSFFTGFDWYKGSGSFLIAEPEKALIDSLYLSACKKRQFSHFPEMHFSAKFNFKKAKYWASIIPNARIRKNVEKKLKDFNKYV